MWKMVAVCLTVSGLGWGDSIYIVGADNSNSPVYWSITPPDPASSSQPFDLGSNASAIARCITFSPTPIFYIGGTGFDTDNDFSRAIYWTIPDGGMASNVNDLTDFTDVTLISINGIAFKSSGEGCMVGQNVDGNASYWTISSSGVVGAPIALTTGGFATAVAFSPAGNGFIAGSDDMNNVCYWTLSAGGMVNGPFGLVGGETGGSASAYAAVVAPSGITYITGADTPGVACYWTISPIGVASSNVELDNGSNGQARGIAFLPTGEGILAGQSQSNNSSYWILEDGSAGLVNNLPNGAGSGSAATGVALSSDGTAYIVGNDDANQAAYWTLSNFDATPDYHLLDSGGVGTANAIAIYFLLAPDAPSNISASFATNDFGLVYEHVASLNWTASSSDVAGYNIYKNGEKIGSVDSSTTHYDNHDQSRSISAEYGVSAVDSEGNESAQTTVTLN